MSNQTRYRLADTLGITLKFRNDYSITGEGIAKPNFGFGKLTVPVKVVDGFWQPQAAMAVAQITGDLMVAVYVETTPSPRTLMVLLDKKDDTAGYVGMSANMEACSPEEFDRVIAGRGKAMFERGGQNWKSGGWKEL